MKSMVLACLVATCAAQLAYPASVAYRVPSHDSAIIQSHRLGGNFAYSTHEAHAYAVQTPVIGQRTVPVGVSYHQGTPIVTSSTQYVNQQIPQYGYAIPQVAGVGAIPYGAYPFGGYPYPYGFGGAIVAAEPAAAAEPAVDTA
ncbi:uncharacterized protein LOC121876159 [Homarus americanus]|uniref:Uncharacterized protein n=1 Tax=Homarus americanus TaxID=6706 RepID=A0A8J5JRU2_HOMAM|nr:uncharacterized protein LOC121876159 [Homarus americanus]KAG7160585.1 hypothetical protein Hamer_G001875 [Homarus americanus]